MSSHTDTIAADDWSLLDDDVRPPTPNGDAESIRRIAARAGRRRSRRQHEPARADPPWVEEMFAEAEARGGTRSRARARDRAARHRLATRPEEDRGSRRRRSRPRRHRHARRATRRSSPCSRAPVTRRPRWQYVSGVAVLALAAAAADRAPQPPEPRRSARVRPAGSPRSTAGSASRCAALGSHRIFGQAARRRSRRRRRHAPARAPLAAERERTRAAAAVAAPHAPGSLRQRRRHARSRAARLPAASASRISACSNPISASTPNCTSSIRARPPIGFEIDACLRGEGGAIGCANDAGAAPRLTRCTAVDADRSLRAELQCGARADGRRHRSPIPRDRQALRRGPRGVGNDHQ